MKEKVKTLGHFGFQIDPQAPLFVIGVTCEIVRMPVWTLRKLDEMGVVSPRRVGARTRCYSQEQICTLNYIRYLMEEQKVSIRSIRVVLEVSGRQT